MGTKINSNYSDLITFTRASGGHALRPVSYGDELVENGDFATDVSGWVDGRTNGTITFSSEKLRVTSDAGNNTAPSQAISGLTVGGVYYVSGFIDQGTAGNTAALVVAENAGLSVNSITIGQESAGGSGTHASAFVASTTTMYVGMVSNVTATGQYSEMDNVSVKEVLFDQPDGTLTLFEHPENVPRVEWDSAGNRLGLLVEEARTNLIGYSDFSSAWGVNLGGVITANQADGLDKTLSMALLETSGISSGIYANTANRATASASGEKYTLSVIVKHVSGGTQLRFRLEGDAFSGSIQGIAVDFSDGSFVSNSNVAPDSYEIKSYGGGFYKVSFSGTTVASGSVIPVFYGNVNEDADFYIGMAQLEAGSFPTSYIKSNSGSTTTRSADVASIPVADFGYNQSAGTLFVDFDMKYEESGSAFPRVVEIASESSIADRIKIQLAENTEVLAAQAYVNFNVQGTCGLGSRTGGSIDSTKVSFAFREADFAASDNGDTAVTDTTGAFAPSVGRDTLAIGKQANASSNFLNGHIKSIKYYPRRLTNAQLVELTS